MKAIITTILTVIVLVGAIALQMVDETMAQPVNGGPELWVNGERPWDSKVFNVTGVLPGDSGAARIELENKGEAGNLTLHLLNLVDTDVVTTEPEALLPAGNLSQNLDITIWHDEDGDGLYDAGEGIIAQDTLDNVACNNYTLGILSSGATTNVSIVWSLDSGVGSEVHSDKSTFDIEFGII